MAMPRPSSPRSPRKPRPPLSAAKLDELAIFYVGRFATSRAKLLSYLNRKIRERGWEDAAPPDLDGLADRLVRLGYVDDRAFAVARSRSLTGRGYGEGRVRQALHLAGIGEDDAAEARDLAGAAAVDSALHFARRRRLGPFGVCDGDPKVKERALAAMIRAGHRFALAKAILETPAGEPIDTDALRDN